MKRAQTALLTSTPIGASNARSIRGESLGDRGARADVGLETAYRQALGRERLDGRCEALRAHVQAGDSSAFARQPFGDRQADAARGAGDDADHARQPRRRGVRREWKRHARLRTDPCLP
jgi:hypothetical protein